VPIGALGIQSHIGPQYKGGQIRTFLKRVSDLGLKIIISELDVRDNPLPAAVPQRDEAVAHGYENYLDTVLPSPAIVAVITWGPL
jgi:endo-1,4-beta-xylanase